MRVEALRAEPDLVGRRVRVAWDVVPTTDAERAPNAAVPSPRLRLRGRGLDFEFEGGDGDGDGDEVVYESATFDDRVTGDLDRPSVRDGGSTTTHVVETVTGAVEVLRRSRWTTRDAEGRFVRRREEVLDVGGGEGLTAGAPRYYELARLAAGGERLRAIATPAAAYALPTARRLYEMLPSVYRRHDVVGPPEAPGARATGPGIRHIPEAAPTGGQLRRFLDAFGLAADHLRSRAEQLRDLHDVATGDARHLPLLAATIGWDLDQRAEATVPRQRHEIRFAATLYRLTGTRLACRIWVRRLTGWDAEVVEFWRNVARTNAPGTPGGDPTSPRDRGSHTVDTRDPDLLAGRGRADDRLDYTYDCRTGPDSRYALDAIGFFLRPPAGVPDEDARAARDRVLANTGLFLPLHLRPVVVIVPPGEGASPDDPEEGP